MKRLFSFLLCLVAVNLYSQEFDGTYKVTYVGAEGDGVGMISPMKVKWYAVVTGDTVTIYDSKKLTDMVDKPFVIGTSTTGDTRHRVVLNILSEKKNEYSIVATTVDDFTKRVTNMVYLLKKEEP